MVCYLNSYVIFVPDTSCYSACTASEKRQNTENEDVNSWLLHF